MTQAPGATPLIGPRLMPKIGALVTMLPAAVLVVCVPWPLLSRAEVAKVSPELFALYVVRNGSPPMTLWLHTKTSVAPVSGLSPKLQARGPLGAAGGVPSAGLSAN